MRDCPPLWGDRAWEREGARAADLDRCPVQCGIGARGEGDDDAELPALADLALSPNRLARARDPAADDHLRALLGEAPGRLPDQRHLALGRLHGREAQL